MSGGRRLLPFLEFARNETNRNGIFVLQGDSRDIIRLKPVLHFNRKLGEDGSDCPVE